MITRAIQDSSRRLVSSDVASRMLWLPSRQMSTTQVDKPKPAKKRESISSYFAFLTGGKLDAADPGKEGIPAKDAKLPDGVEAATGEQKLLMLAFEQGIIDPYCNLPVERRGGGTRDNPVKVKSFTNYRYVGCICEPNQNHVKYTILNMGEPKRCFCGHWLELVEAPKFWTKIPKEDLLTIPYFMELEAEGKLDAVLAGEEPDDHHHGHDQKKVAAH